MELLSCPLGSPALEEVSHHIMKTFKQPCRKSFMVKKAGLLPTVSIELLAM